MEKQNETAGNAFQTFYRASLKRLTEKNEAYNETIRQEQNPVLRPFQYDFTRMNEGGKCLRGMLVNLGAVIAGREAEESDVLALAFELFQTAVLIHDDVIDKAELRRGNVTIHRRYEESLRDRGIRMVSGSESYASLGASAAICAGDLGLFYSNLILAEHYTGHPKLGQLIGYFDKVIIDTIRGELLDVVLPYELQDSSLDEEEQNALLESSVMEIYRLKTAQYSIIGPLHLGMLLGDRTEEEMSELDSVCEDLGIAFQIKDDLLGVFGDPDTIGKDLGSDISEYKQTILYMYVMTKAPSFKADLETYYGREALSADDIRRVQEIFRLSGAERYAADTMEACFRRAGEKLKNISFMDENTRLILTGFMEYLRNRTK